MDTREKMVDLVKNSLRAYGKDLEKTVEPFEFIADFLISNGVTVQGVTDNNVGCKWISVKDRLPDGNTAALVIVSGKPRKNITLDAAYELAEYDPIDGWILEMWPEWKGAVVTHLMPLPDFPKG